MRRLVTLLLAVFLLAACSAGSGATVTPSSATPAAASTTAVTTATVTTTPSAPAADTALAARLATLACQSYVYAGTLSAAEGSAPLDDAASTGTSAAVVDPAWTDLAGALAFLAALPLTDVAAEDQDRAATEITVIEQRCGDAGVTVS